MANHPNLKKNPSATVRSVAELTSLPSTVTQIIIDNGVGDSSFTELDLSRFTQLRLLEIGNNSLCYVTTVKMIGLSELEVVLIGKNSFAREFGQFYLKNCPSLRELKVGRYSFSDYTVCEIDNVDALVTIVIGDLNADSYNFPFAFLTLRGWWDAKGDHP